MLRTRRTLINRVSHLTTEAKRIWDRIEELSKAACENQFVEPNEDEASAWKFAANCAFDLYDALGELHSDLDPDDALDSTLDDE